MKCDVAAFLSYDILSSFLYQLFSVPCSALEVTRVDHMYHATCFTRNSGNPLEMENAFDFFQPDTRRFKLDQMKIIILICLKWKTLNEATSCIYHNLLRRLTIHVA